MNTLKCIINNALFPSDIPELTGEGLRQLYRPLKRDACLSEQQTTNRQYTWYNTWFNHVNTSVDLLKM